MTDSNQIPSTQIHDMPKQDGDVIIEVTATQFYLFMFGLISVLTIIIAYIYYSKYKYIMDQRQKFSQFSKLANIASDDEDISIVPLKH